MALVVSRQSPHDVIPLANTPEYPPEHWLINPTMPDGVPYKYIKVAGDTVVEMTIDEKNAVDNPPESMADRHAREQATGVDVQHVGLVKYDERTIALWHGLLALLDRRGGDLPGVQVWNAAGQEIALSVAQANEAVDDYVLKASMQVMRQLSEGGNG